ncbi:MAG: hypothetical protein AAF439_05160 [Pseudomonadota bacterium]
MKRFMMAAFAACAIPTIAFAEFEVEEAETEENVVAFESINSVFFGNVNTGDTRSTHGFAVTWGVLHGWKSGLELEIENERGESPAFEGMEWINVFAIMGNESVVGLGTEGSGGDNDEGGGFALALNSSFEIEFDDANEVSMTVGPIVGADLGLVDLGLNTFVEIPLGGDGEAGFSYAASALMEVEDELHVGIEAHGEVDDIFESSPPFDQQSHFIGPVVATELELDEGQEVGLRFGAFMGLTDATPDFALSVNVEFEFE